uniref:Uncharacterized protein n=1 Tax=viral metagenome TaxID=1070528 RepID=A0A6C0HL68_9ZZZZ
MNTIIKVLHISNHTGTIANANSVITYLEQYDKTVKYSLTTMKWDYSYYINESQANIIFTQLKDYISTFTVLLFTDTPMCARPFLQNIDSHKCLVIQYVCNRIDWGIWGIWQIWQMRDDAFMTMFKKVSHHQRVRIIADNRYDQYYAEIMNVKFIYNDCVRLCPQLCNDIIMPVVNGYKLFIQNRGNLICNYSEILNSINVKYDVYGEDFAKYRDTKHICEYIGILHLPYQVNIQSLWENLAYSIVYFIPSKRFLKELIDTCKWYYWEEKSKDISLLCKSIELSEWYAEELSGCFEYFDSWKELGDKYHTFNCNVHDVSDAHNTHTFPAWYIERRLIIYKTAHSLVKYNLRKWHLLFNNLIKQQPLVVTMFYNIRKKDNDISDFHRKQETFYELAANFILKIKGPLFICMDEDDEEFHTFVMSKRREYGLAELTYCYRENFEKSYFYKYVDRIKELQSSYQIYNGNARHETPLYITLNNNKFYYMERAIELNPTNSEKFIWLDMGINHVAKEPFLIEQWLDTIPVDKIKQMCINPLLESDKHCDIFHNIYHHTAGGLFAGGLQIMQKYITLYKSKTEQIYNDEAWYQIDEAIMTMIQWENRGMFDFYYGDYEGIITNFTVPKYSIELILVSAEKCLKFNNTLETFKIMKYLEPYFISELHQTGDALYKYININIICNYYHNGKQLLDSVIGLINSKLVKGCNRMKHMVSSNAKNLEFYTNKDCICECG